MTKAELINAVQQKCKSDITKTLAEEVIDSFCEIIMESLARKNDVTVSGFGSFRAVKRAERKGRNPRTGESINIPEVWVAKFVPGKAFKEIMN